MSTVGWGCENYLLGIIVRNLASRKGFSPRGVQDVMERLNNERLLHGKRAGEAFRRESENHLQKILGKGGTGL